MKKLLLVTTLSFGLISTSTKPIDRSPVTNAIDFLKEIKKDFEELPTLVSSLSDSMKQTKDLVMTIKGKKAAMQKRDEVRDYYSRWGGEEKRLFVKADGIIERLRTESILRRNLPKQPAIIYDVGGGAGVYAFPLAKQGYTVHLIDFTPLHIEQAKKKMFETGIKLAECSVGDARDIKAKDTVADVVLLFGPLYHLQAKKDRIKALREAYRILKPGGTLFVAAISRFVGILKFLSADTTCPVLSQMAEASFKTGKFTSPEDGPKTFTDAYFHFPTELKEEISEAGFKNVSLFNIEGPSWHSATLKETVKDKKKLETLGYLLEMIENEHSAMGITSHFMAIGKK